MWARAPEALAWEQRANRSGNRRVAARPPVPDQIVENENRREKPIFRNGKAATPGLDGLDSLPRLRLLLPFFTT
jgi:hypothetical protein